MFFHQKTPFLHHFFTCFVQLRKKCQKWCRHHFFGFFLTPQKKWCKNAKKWCWHHFFTQNFEKGDPPKVKIFCTPFLGKIFKKKSAKSGASRGGATSGFFKNMTVFRVATCKSTNPQWIFRSDSKIVHKSTKSTDFFHKICKICIF